MLNLRDCSKLKLRKKLYIIKPNLCFYGLYGFGVDEIFVFFISKFFYDKYFDPNRYNRSPLRNSIIKPAFIFFC